LTQIQISHLFKLNLHSIRCIDVHCLTLSVERVDLMIDIIIETLIWEVLLGAFHHLAVHLIILDVVVNNIIYEVIMC
jgi:hypothetical protein